ncbi:MAG TPA: hypothetical protein VKB92_12850 [Myxococcales bacterium]|nr:hypothetical protein [Myxococcales bacterium]
MSNVKWFAAAALLASPLAVAQTPERPQQPTATAQPDAGPPEAPGAAPLTPREKAAAQASEQAKKDVDVAGIHLEVARLYLAGLYGLAGPSSTWDREHGVALFTQAQNALTDADRQLAELQGLAQRNWPDARDPLSRARATMVRVQTQLRSLSVPLRTGGGQVQAGQSVIREVYKSLDSSRDELNSAAKAMGVDPKLRTP